MDAVKMIDDEIIRAFFGDYLYVYYLDYPNGNRLMRIMDPTVKKVWDDIFSKTKDYVLSTQEMIKTFAYPGDVERVMNAYNLNFLFDELKDKKKFTCYYRRKTDGDYKYEKLTVCKLEDENEPARTLLFCCANADEEMHEKMLRDEERKQYFSVVYALGKEYTSVYYVNLDNNKVTPYNISRRIEGMFGDSFYKTDYDEAVKAYIAKAVCDGEKEVMTEVMSRSYVLDKLKENDYFTWVYLNNDQRYCEMKCVKVDSDDGSNIAVMGFAVKDNEIRLERENKRQLEFHLALLDGLSREYDTLWLLMDNKRMILYRVSDKVEAQQAAVEIYSETDFDEGMAKYINLYVIEEDKERLHETLKYDNVVTQTPEQGLYTVTYRRYIQGGKDLYLQMCFSRAAMLNGEMCIVCGVRNVDDIVREENRKRELYNNAVKDREYDVMTGLRNRFSYEHALLGYPQRKNDRISCVYIDIDGLHDFNNSHGHDEGDKLIKCIADNIRSVWGSEDSFRIGGDEFVVFLFDWDTSILEKEIAILKDNIAKNNYSVSVGSSRDSLQNIELEYLIKDAEKMMYAEKISHREELGLSRV